MEDLRARVTAEFGELDSALWTAVGLGTRNPPCRQFRSGPKEGHKRFYVWKLHDELVPVCLK